MIKNDTKTAVFLSKTECALFILLAKANALDVKNGSFEVFIERGVPTKIKRIDFVSTGLSPHEIADSLTVVV